jgi:outer membrane protein
LRNPTLIVAMLGVLASGGLRAQTAAPPVAPQPTATDLSAMTRPVAGLTPMTLSQTLTLDQALARALEVNTAIGRSKTQVGIAEQQKRLLFTNLLPRVNGSGGLQRNSEQVTFGSGADASTILPLNDWNYRIVLTQPVFAGNRERRAYEQAKLNVRATQEGARLTEDQILLRVASNYMAVVDSDALVDVETKNIGLAEKRKAQSEAFYSAGEVTKVDVLRAETAIKAAQRALASAQQVRDTAAGRLRVDLNLEGPVQVVSSTSTAAPSVPEEGSLLTMAAQRRPEIEQAQAGVQIAQLEVRKQRGNYLPTISAEAGYINQKSAFPAPRYSYGALRFNVPIFQSGELEARVATAREQELQARLQLDETKLNVREDVRKSLVDLRTADTNLNLAREQATAAEAEYNQAFELYRAQESTSLDLAASETSLADARRAVVQSTLDRQLAALQVFYAAGTLKQALMENPR